MIEHTLDTAHSILYVRPKSKLEHGDFVQLAKTVDPHIEEKGDLAGLIIEVTSFPGWESFGAMASHFRFVRDHHKHIKKIAVVTDSPLGNVAEHLASHFVAAEIRRFPAAELEAAEQWVMNRLDSPGHMDRAALDGVELEYEIRGVGEPVVLVHHGAGADWFRPLLEEPALTDRYRLFRYHRAGYAGSSPLATALTFAQEAVTFRGLMQHLGVDRAHLVGHSASACIALQIALDVPEIVHSIALLEPALLAVPSPPEVPQAIELYRAGELTAALDTFLRGTCGPQYRAVLEKAIPGALDQALADAGTFFRHELPALRQWSFGPDEARRVRQPVLAVVGATSDARFQQRQKLLLEWMPNVEPFVLAGAGHLLHLQNPSGMAAGLAAFFGRHSLGVAH